MPHKDLHYMRHALRLAASQLGRAWPNPAVGCVIVKDGVVVGTGATAAGGRPHAEPQALDMAGDSAKGATLYVTLEPCAHTGKTPPCAEAIIEAGIARVVCATQDPDPRTQGQGFSLLKEAGINVELGIEDAATRALNEGFIKRITQHQPLVSLKLATTLDGKMANADGQSQWITGEKARAYGHALRASHDAILTGIGTVDADDPALTCRISGREADSPLRIILDSQLTLSPESRLAQTAKESPVWVITSAEHASSDMANTLSQEGVRVLGCGLEDNRIDLSAMLTLLADEGLTRVLVEAGPTLCTAFLKQQLVDELHWFRAPFCMGAGAQAAIQPFPIITPSEAARWALKNRFSLGEDTCEHYRVAPCLPASSAT